MWPYGLAQDQAIVQFDPRPQIGEQQEPPGVYVHVRRVVGEVGGDQKFHSVLMDRHVFAGVPPAYVSIDRYFNNRAGSRRVAE